MDKFVLMFCYSLKDLNARYQDRWLKKKEKASFIHIS